MVLIEENYKNQGKTTMNFNDRKLNRLKLFSLDKLLIDPRGTN